MLMRFNECLGLAKNRYHPTILFFLLSFQIAPMRFFVVVVHKYTHSLRTINLFFHHCAWRFNMTSIIILLWNKFFFLIAFCYRNQSSITPYWMDVLSILRDIYGTVNLVLFLFFFFFCFCFHILEWDQMCIHFNWFDSNQSI